MAPARQPWQICVGILQRYTRTIATRNQVHKLNETPFGLRKILRELPEELEGLLALAPESPSCKTESPCSAWSAWCSKHRVLKTPSPAQEHTARLPSVENSSASAAAAVKKTHATEATICRSATHTLQPQLRMLDGSVPTWHKIQPSQTPASAAAPRGGSPTTMGIVSILQETPKGRLVKVTVFCSPASVPWDFMARILACQAYQLAQLGSSCWRLEHDQKLFACTFSLLGRLASRKSEPG